MNDARSPHPPTSAGELARPDLPLSRPAIWAMLCGAIGLVLPPISVAGVALGILALRRLSRQHDERQGRGLAVGGLVTGTLGLALGALYLFIFLSIAGMRQQARESDVAGWMENVRATAFAFANKNQHYPQHVAILAVDRTMNFSDRLAISEAWDERQRVRLVVGDYDFMQYDGTFEADDAARAAIEAVDKSSAIYSYGDANFVRLSAPTNSRDIVFCWRTYPDPSVFTAIMDDGTVERGGVDAWAVLLQRDTNARVQLGLGPSPLPDEP